jgi:hypothetical protein
MLTIRKEQMAVFSQEEARKFEERMLVHLRKFFPKECEAGGAAQLRETVKHGLKRAGSYGITAERDVCKYIDLMIVFGCDFDMDKQYPWAGEILETRNSPAAKLAVLLEAAKKKLRQA